MKKLLSIFIIIFISFNLIGCSDKSTEIVKLKDELQSSKQKIKELESSIAALEKEKKDLEARETLTSSDTEDKATEYINNIDKLNSFSDIVDVYYPELDAAPAEAYSYKLYSLYKANGIDKLIDALMDKDDNTIKSVANLLAGGCLMAEDDKSLDNLIKALNKINSKKLDNKKKHIVLLFLDQCNLAKTLIK